MDFRCSGEREEDQTIAEIKEHHSEQAASQRPSEAVRYGITPTKNRQFAEILLR